MHRTSVLPAILVVSCLSLSLSALSARAEDLPRFDIPAQPLVDSLRAVASQTNMNVFFEPKLVAGRPAPAVSNTEGVEAALKKLLAGSGLTYRFVDAKTVTVIPENSVKETINKESVDSTAIGSLRLAQTNGMTRGGTAGGEWQVPPGIEEEKEEGVRLEEIVVTGTHIRGMRNPTTPIQVYDREAIARTGRTTTQEFLKTLTVNFKGGDSGTSEDGVLNGRGGLTNLESASSPNLRGLGSNSTLVLLNGHRLAASAYGASVDVSTIPLEAIERVEVLTDGASAVYGADAVGGVVNFILRKDYEGAETSLRAGSTTGGGREEYAVSQTFAGKWSEGGGALATLQYQHANALTTRQRSFTKDVPGPTDLFPSRAEYTAILSAHQQLSSSVNLSGDVLYSTQDQERNYDNEIEDHFQSADVDSLSTSATLEWAAFSDWKLAATAVYGRVGTLIRSRYSPPQDDYENGSREIENRFALEEGNLKADGSLFSIPGGPIRMAIGAAYRHEELTNEVFVDPPPARFDRNVRSAFAELLFPLISASNARPWLRSLTLSVAERYDHYSGGLGSTGNPKFGLAWEPGGGLRLRASYGTSFRAPSFNQISAQESNRVAVAFPGFAQPDGIDRPILLLASSPALSPEKSRNVNVGLEFSPPAVSALTLSADYYRIVYDDRLVFPPFEASALLHPEIFGSLIGQFDPGEATDFVNDLVLHGFDFFDIAGEGTDGILNSYTTGLVNASRVRQDGLDLRVRYSIQRGADRFGVLAEATRINEITTAFCASCVSTNILDIYGEPLRTRLRGAASWERGGAQLNLAVNYVNSYRDTNIVPAGRIASWTTVDANFRYTPRYLAGTTFALNVINLLDKEPPTTAGAGLASSITYDSANADPLGRAVSAQLQKRW